MTLQQIPKPTIMELVDAAYEKQWSDGRKGNPQDPETQHRREATYNAWFMPSAGSVLRHAKYRTSSKDCARVRSCLRLRLGAMRIAANRGRHNALTPFPERICVLCRELGLGQHVEDVQHVCFECSSLKGQLAGLGWSNAPGNAENFQQLFTRVNMRAAARYVDDIANLVAQRAQ